MEIREVLLQKLDELRELVKQNKLLEDRTFVLVEDIYNTLIDNGIDNRYDEITDVFEKEIKGGY